MRTRRRIAVAIVLTGVAALVAVAPGACSWPDPPPATVLWVVALDAFGKRAMADGVALGPDGSVYVTGFTNGDIEGLTNVSSANWGNYDNFLAKYDAQGTRQWLRLVGASDPHQNGVYLRHQRNGVAVDAEGGVYVVGGTMRGLHSTSSPTLGLTLLEGIGNSDAFLVKYNADGIVEWSRLFGWELTSTYAYDVTVDDGSYCVWLTGTTDHLMVGGRSESTHLFFARCSKVSALRAAEHMVTIAKPTNNNCPDPRTAGFGICMSIGGQPIIVGATEGSMPGRIDDPGPMQDGPACWASYETTDLFLGRWFRLGAEIPSSRAGWLFQLAGDLRDWATDVARCEHGGFAEPLACADQDDIRRATRRRTSSMDPLHRRSGHFATLLRRRSGGPSLAIGN